MSDAQYDDFCWGLSDPNGDWDGSEDACFINRRAIRNRDPNKWYCKDGTVLNIVDMTDSHIDNAIAYCERTGNPGASSRLRVEKQQRIDLKYVAIKMECPFCEGTMQRRAYHSTAEDGVGTWWEKYAFTCNDCGARGPLHDKHEPKTIQRSTAERIETSIRRDKVVLGRRVKTRSVF